MSKGDCLMQLIRKFIDIFTPEEDTSGSLGREAESRRGNVVRLFPSDRVPLYCFRAAHPEDMKQTADRMREMHPVLLSLEGAEASAAQRMLDFLAGAAYACRAQIRPIAKDLYLLAPYDVDFTVDAPHGDRAAAKRKAARRRAL